MKVAINTITIVACCLCGGCADSTGMHFIIRTSIEAAAPATLSVTYSNSEFDSYDFNGLEDMSWEDPIIIDVDYGPNAVDGPARARLTCRPDPPRAAATNFVADLSASVTISMNLELVPLSVASPGPNSSEGDYENVTRIHLVRDGDR